jgi:hypothetical protein
MTRAELLDQVYHALDERLVVENPPLLGKNVMVTRGVVEGCERVVVAQPGGQQFAVTVSEIDFSEART